jgi:hypothetical protein
MVADATAGRQTVACPDCGTPVRPDRERLCPTCGYPLVLLRSAPVDAEAGPARVPGEQGEATDVFRTDLFARGATTVDDQPPPGLDEVECPRCRERNPLERIRCQRCGLELQGRRPTPVAAPLLPEPVLPFEPEPPRPKRGNRWMIPVGWALVIAAALIAAAAFFATRGPDLSNSQEQDPPAGNGGLVRVAQQDIQASASSTLPNDPRFNVANTVDGKNETTWQSDGKRLRSNVGVSLTYRFARELPLARITVVNGDARSERDFTNNERVRRLQVRAGSWVASWELKDTTDPQSIDVDAGLVSAVTLEVEATYPGTTFKDVAISEVIFEVPDGSGG